MVNKPVETFAEGFLNFQTCQDLQVNPNSLTQDPVERDLAETGECLGMAYLKWANIHKTSY